jgi:hypothetical protein
MSPYEKSEKDRKEKVAGVKGAEQYYTILLRALQSPAALAFCNKLDFRPLSHPNYKNILHKEDRSSKLADD